MKKTNTNKTLLLMMVMAFLVLNLNAQQQNRGRVNNNYSYNPYAAQAAYWNSFNQSMNGVYRGAQVIQNTANNVVNYGSRIVPRYGTVIRQGYNTVQQGVQQNFNYVPRRYSYPN